MSLLDLFRRGEPDDAVAALERPAGGHDPVPELPAAISRRDRAANAGSAMLMESLAQKVMHGWLQNRHQTLVPLTLNLRVLAEPQGAVVAGAAAGLLLAGRPREDAMAAAPKLRAWLDDLGADSASLAAFDRALSAPPPLDQIMERTLELGVPVYTYMTGLTASDPRYPASGLLCDALQARFELPIAVARSVARRYRRIAT